MTHATPLFLSDRYASHDHPELTFGENDVYLAEGKELEVSGMADYMRRAAGVHTEMHQPRVVVRGDVAWTTRRCLELAGEWR